MSGDVTFKLVLSASSFTVSGGISGSLCVDYRREFWWRLTNLLTYLLKLIYLLHGTESFLRSQPVLS